MCKRCFKNPVVDGCSRVLTEHITTAARMCGCGGLDQMCPRERRWIVILVISRIVKSRDQNEVVFLFALRRLPSSIRLSFYVYSLYEIDCSQIARRTTPTQSSFATPRERATPNDSSSFEYHPDASQFLRLTSTNNSDVDDLLCLLTRVEKLGVNIAFTF